MTLSTPGVELVVKCIKSLIIIFFMLVDQFICEEFPRKEIFRNIKVGGQRWSPQDCGAVRNRERSTWAAEGWLKRPRRVQKEGGSTRRL